MKYIKHLALIAIAVSTLSCDDLLNGLTTESVADLEGTWNCDEQSTIFKSANDIYTVYIEPLEDDSTMVSISNFYSLGFSTFALAKVSGYSITLNTQKLEGGFTVRGSGTISQNRTEISWKYYVDDGSGVEDEVDALYELQN